MGGIRVFHWRELLPVLGVLATSGCGGPSLDASTAMEATVPADANPVDGGGAVDGSFPEVVVGASADGASGITTLGSGLSQRMLDAPDDSPVTGDLDSTTDGPVTGDLDATTDGPVTGDLDATTDGPVTGDLDSTADVLVEGDLDSTADVLVEGDLDVAPGVPDAGYFDAPMDRLLDGDFEAATNDAAPSELPADGGAICPPAPSPCLILPLGDSITDGFAVHGGYRVPLFHRVLVAGQHATFVGSQQNGPAQVDGVPFPPDHEGHVGFAIDPFADREGISPLTPGALRTYQPHIVTLMIGTNDMDLQFDVANAPKRLGALLDSIFRTAPGVAVVLAQITPTSDDALNQRIAAYNAAMQPLVDAQLSAGRHIQLVDMYGAMTSVAGYQTALLGDRLHPNEAGYAVMADVWYRALAAMLR